MVQLPYSKVDHENIYIAIMIVVKHHDATARFHAVEAIMMCIGLPNAVYTGQPSPRAAAHMPTRTIGAMIDPQRVRGQVPVVLERHFWHLKAVGSKQVQIPVVVNVNESGSPAPVCVEHTKLARPIRESAIAFVVVQPVTTRAKGTGLINWLLRVNAGHTGADMNARPTIQQQRTQ